MTDRDLLHNLGIQPNHRVCLRGIKNPAFAAMVCAQVEYPPSNAVSGRYDVIVMHVNADDDLERIPALAKHLEPTGALWIVHPNGAANVRSAGLRAGLVNNKNCAYDERFTAARYVPRAI